MWPPRSAPYLPSISSNYANWGTASWAEAILGLPALAPVYQQAITHGRVFGGNLQYLADWGTCGGGADDGSTNSYGAYNNSVMRQVLSSDSKYAWRNLTRENINGYLPNTWLFDWNGSSGSHSANQYNQLYYFGNEPDQSSPFCSLPQLQEACACVYKIRIENGSPISTNTNYDAWAKQFLNQYWDWSSLYLVPALGLVISYSLARIFKEVKATIEGQGRGHMVLPPSATDPYRAVYTRSYWNNFYYALKTYLGLASGPTIPGSYLRALHFHSYSPIPNSSVQFNTPLKSMAFTAGIIKLAVDWYAATHSADRNFNIVLSEFGLLWQAKYETYYGVDYRPKIMAGFWTSYNLGLEWWSTLLCWITRLAGYQCGLQGWNVGLPNSWTPDNTVYAMIHEPDMEPYTVINNVVFPPPPGYPDTPLTMRIAPLSRNQWFFHADAWATYYKPQPLGLEKCSQTPGLETYQQAQYRPVYQTSFTSFFNDADQSQSTPVQWTAAANVTRSYRRTPLGVCYAVWAHPKVGGGPAFVNDLNQGWVLNQQVGFIGQAQAQITLPGGYCTVYVPVVKGYGATGVQLAVQFTDGTNVVINGDHTKLCTCSSR